MTVFPLDLIDLIIQEVADSNPGKTGHLTPLLSVSKIFRLITHKYIFKPVLEIRPHPSDGFSNPHRTNLLFDILSGDSDLCDRVSRRVNIYMPRHDPCSNEDLQASRYRPLRCRIHAERPREERPGDEDINFRPLLNLLATAQLKELKIYGGSRLKNLEKQNFPHLKSLHLIQNHRLYFHDYPPIAKLLTNTSALEDFFLTVADIEKQRHGVVHHRPFDQFGLHLVGEVLAGLQKLRFIELRDNAYAFTGNFLSSLAVIFESMQPETHTLKELCIHLCFVPSKGLFVDSAEGWVNGWARLGEALRQIDTLTSVRMTFEQADHPSGVDARNRLDGRLRDAVVKSLDRSDVIVHLEHVTSRSSWPLT